MAPRGETKQVGLIESGGAPPQTRTANLPIWYFAMWDSFSGTAEHLLRCTDPGYVDSWDGPLSVPFSQVQLYMRHYCEQGITVGCEGSRSEPERTEGECSEEEAELDSDKFGDEAARSNRSGLIESHQVPPPSWLWHCYYLLDLTYFHACNLCQCIPLPLMQNILTLTSPVFRGFRSVSLTNSIEYRSAQASSTKTTRSSGATGPEFRIEKLSPIR
ncbi:MAG: hypothetical protein GY696_40715 [Gammaproteobacteria bacterium]|nr:hypothetical protein [Gammaproteobacteria bacterium]